MTAVNNRTGIYLMIATSLVFAAQDGISRHLAGEYNVLMVVMIRYWFFGAFVEQSCPTTASSDHSECFYIALPGIYSMVSLETIDSMLRRGDCRRH